MIKFHFTSETTVTSPTHLPSSTLSSISENEPAEAQEMGENEDGRAGFRPGEGDRIQRMLTPIASHRTFNGSLNGSRVYGGDAQAAAAVASASTGLEVTSQPPCPLHRRGPWTPVQVSNKPHHSCCSKLINTALSCVHNPTNVGTWQVRRLRRTHELSDLDRFEKRFTELVSPYSKRICTATIGCST